jgi:hypothetical protein
MPVNRFRMLLILFICFVRSNISLYASPIALSLNLFFHLTFFLKAKKLIINDKKANVFAVDDGSSRLSIFSG